MNGGAYGGETKDVLIEARGVDRAGNVRTYTNADMGFSYRHSGVPDDVIFTEALFQGRAGDPEAIAAEMAEIKKKREASQPSHQDLRLDLQEPAGAEGLATDRCRRLPRAYRWRRAGLRPALQFPAQSR